MKRKSVNVVLLLLFAFCFVTVQFSFPEEVRAVFQSEEDEDREREESGREGRLKTSEEDEEGDRKKAAKPKKLGPPAEATGETGTSPGDKIPEIEGEDVDGVEFALSDYEGKVLMIDFWGDW